MAKKKDSKKSKGDNNQKYRVDFTAFSEQDERPKIAVYAIDRSAEMLNVSAVDKEGVFSMPDSVLKKAHKILIGPKLEKEDDITRISKSRISQFRTGHFRNLLEPEGIIRIPRQQWTRWITVTRCINGTVRRCFPYPFVLRNLLKEAQTSLQLSDRPARDLLGNLPDIGRDLPDYDFWRPIFPFRCESVCDGLVEVYERRCCCRPIIVWDPRIPEIIKDLEDQIPEIPKPKFPPDFPDPPPPPFEDLPFFNSGAINEQILHARKDLSALHSLPAEEQPAYINARPYLFCSCSSAAKVAQGQIQPGGTFNICWRGPLRLLFPNCHYEYAFVVRQHINGVTTVIYDGRTANQWFEMDDDIRLTSYHPQAIGCRSNEFPGEGAFALLQDIGDTESYHLKTPDATGWDRVAAPAYNDGLAYPVANPVHAIGALKNRNWGGSLKLRYHFSEAMKGIGARYYRISVIPANSLGNPTGQRRYLNNGVTWKKYIIDGTDINVENEGLGPVTVGGTTGLFKIPYDADSDWQSGQYHAVLNTNQPELPHGRYLLTLEVFDGSGDQLKPNSAPGGDPGTAADFTFRRWYQETGPTDEVPFGALSHMLWWDNRHAYAEIVNLKTNSSSETGQCQFISGDSSTNFSIGYRAYHPEEMFQLNHTIRWHRGLGGPSETMDKKSSNVGVPPLSEGESSSHTFGYMLSKPPGGPFKKCSFSIILRVRVKTYNGEGTLSGLDDWDQAAFALEQTT